MVERLFLAVPWGCLQFVIVVFPDHTHLLFCKDSKYCYQPAGHIVTGDLKILLIQEFGLLYVNDLQQVSIADVVKKLLVTYKKFGIDGVSEIMSNIML